MPTHGFSTKPLKVKLLAGEQKATEVSKTCRLPWLELAVGLPLAPFGTFGLQLLPVWLPPM